MFGKILEVKETFLVCVSLVRVCHLGSIINAQGLYSREVSTFFSRIVLSFSKDVSKKENHAFAYNV